MQHKLLKFVVGVVIVGSFSIAAWWGGTEASRLIWRPTRDELRSHREDFTKGILQEMRSIDIGDTLPDYEYFENLESEIVRLSNAVTGPTWLVFMLTDCHECMEELHQLYPVLSDRQRKNQVIFISNSNPLDMLDVRKDFNLKVPMLHDRNGTYIDGIKVFTFPFNILIDKDLVIRRIVVGHLEAEDVQ